MHVHLGACQFPLSYIGCNRALMNLSFDSPPNAGEVGVVVIAHVIAEVEMWQWFDCRCRAGVSSALPTEAEGKNLPAPGSYCFSGTGIITVGQVVLQCIWHVYVH